ncbi:hypothetical protein GCM10007893_21290 [Paracoccus marinus]|nr:hypothetical protein GCM10007893_21290 [Paracoccus marinus]
MPTIKSRSAIGTRAVFSAFAISGLVTCGPAPENDPVYLALKANPPSSVPQRHIDKLRHSAVSCDVFNEGQSREYMTCWLAVNPDYAQLSYFGPGLIKPPKDMLIEHGGTPLTGFLPIK